MPKGDDDVEGWNKLYTKLGRPETPEGYGIKAAEGQDPTLANAAASKFHELGLTEKQGQALTNWWAEQSQGLLDAQSAAQAQSAEQAIAELKNEWGNKYDENVELGRRAAREYGLDADALGKIEGALGTKGLLDLMAKIGRGQGEAEFIGQGKTSFGMSPEAARARIQALKGDAEWTGRYLKGDADARAELERLHRLGYPE